MSDKDNFKICPKTSEAILEYLRAAGHSEAASSLEKVLKMFINTGEKND